ncbi:alpha/beta hydrolase [Rhizobium sp. VS19-DR104.2]|nr:alpha/beta hydrolase [Rhizobium sp. VS19-DR129.2]MBZ5762357.1 alpha/beta hydrolase [Rhizobium sp. VS19-DR96]MBZ5775937.1 alpha/beta hydrolase [Rhizobium sp. VS19-DRK62.2]MBZ5786299.1 alpha/beta hydrolase [Rhizobium sp. VS19-DR121]MBZ5820189.1 alpha/beta hydrolase [Rhizobium sp. VS19-DR183]MBZ5832102.1 alpha/beta hydrolase [Rhizobium sp. VS19-DR104.2]MBZ5843918.1 alpha/beta hydrolase [Rhizobium sp. VS19-DR104.1]QXZ80675.1 alpha/beta hydrolase [Rhizobium sp. L51/94]
MTPIVMIPGLLCSAELYAPQMAALWPFGSVTVASTLSGTTMSEIATNILRDAPPSFALVGLSMGGYVALEIMRQAPERVSKLALLDTSARPDTQEQVAQRRGMLAQAKGGDFNELLSQVMSILLHPAHRDDQHLLEVNIRMGLTVGVEGFERQTEAIIGRADSCPHLADITVPTLVLVGDCDSITPPFLSKEIAAAIPDSSLVIIPKCGHGSTLEQPEAVNRALVTWLEGA